MEQYSYSPPQVTTYHTDGNNQRLSGLTPVEAVYTTSIRISRNVLQASKWSFCEHAIYMYIAFFSCHLMATPMAVWVVLRFYNYVTYLKETGRTRGYLNQVTATLTLSTEIYCWMGFVTLYVLHYIILHDFEHYQLTRSNALPELYLPCSTPGYYMLYATGGIFLLEFPFLVYYINKHTTNTRCGTNRKKCMSRGCNIIKSAGWTGMVYYLQILTGYFAYYLMLLIASPVYAIAYCAVYISVSVLVTAIMSLLTHCCMHGRRSQFRGCCFLLSATLVAFNVFLLSSVLDLISRDNIQTSFNASQIISATFTSVLFAMLVYFARKILFNTTHGELYDDNIIANNIQTNQPLAEIAVREDEEMISLLDKECE